MEIMLEQTNNYYDKMNKSYEKKVVKREEQEQEQEQEEEEEEEEEGVQEAFSSLKMS
jgi:F0F1-type ATP synthase assembly protein I